MDQVRSIRSVVAEEGDAKMGGAIFIYVLAFMFTAIICVMGIIALVDANADRSSLFSFIACLVLAIGLTIVATVMFASLSYPSVTEWGQPYSVGSNGEAFRHPSAVMYRGVLYKVEPAKEVPSDD